MVFKRRNARTHLQRLRDSVWPRGGWTRAFRYVRHRIRRLPDDPRRIARGVAAGVFSSFTPFFGLHVAAGVVVAWIVRGNVLAALLGTLFGNPLTFPLIAVVSMKLGHRILGTRFDESEHATIVGRFVGAGEDLKHNFFALFTDDAAHWANLYNFWNEIFLPYLAGGLLQHLQVIQRGFAVDDARQHAIHPAGAFATGRALAAGLGVVETRDALAGTDHASGLVHDDDRTRAEAGTGLLDAVVVHG